MCDMPRRGSSFGLADGLKLDQSWHGMRKSRVLGQVLAVQGMNLQDATTAVDADGDRAKSVGDTSGPGACRQERRAPGG